MKVSTSARNATDPFVIDLVAQYAAESNPELSTFKGRRRALASVVWFLAVTWAMQQNPSELSLREERRRAGPCWCPGSLYLLMPKHPR